MKKEENEKVTMVILVHDEVDNRGNSRIRETYLPEGNIFPKIPPEPIKTVTAIDGCGNSSPLDVYRAIDLIEGTKGMPDNLANIAILGILKELNPDTPVGIR